MSELRVELHVRPPNQPPAVAADSAAAAPGATSPGVQSADLPAPSGNRNPRTRRLWKMRAVAVALPFFAVIALEGLFRVAGWYADDPAASDRRPVRYEQGTVFFPEWDDQIASPKPSGVRRVFVLGGSTTWGFGVDQPFGTLLNQRLQREYPRHRWEVINGGVPAYGSHRVLEVARRATTFEPDLIVVYFGHNEFLEEIFFEANEDFARAAKRRRFARQFRLVRFFTDLANGDEASTRELRREFFGNTHFPLIRSEEQYRLRLKFLESNLRELIACCRKSHARLVVVPAIANLLWRPGDSAHGAGYRKQQSTWNRLYKDARKQFQSQRWRDAVETFTALEQIDSEHAETHYLHGLALLELDDGAGAGEQLQLANLCDRRGDRVNPDVFRTIVEVCRSESTPVLDLRPQFHGELHSELDRLHAGEKPRMFLDHCHPTPAGHAIISDEIVGFLSRSGWFDDSRGSGRPDSGGAQ